MSKRLKIKILSENTVYKRNLRAEHGLSFYFEYGDKKYLFDTGQGLVLKDNADQLDIDLKEIDTVILSHGHDDHTGGLKELLKINPSINVAAHPDLFIPKYKIENNKNQFIGTDVKIRDINFINAREKEEVSRGINISKDVKVKDNSSFKKRYIIKDNKQEKVDKFNDEISLYIETEKGLVILLGCSHKGIVNIIKDIKERTNQRIAGILGGLHLKHSSGQEVIEIMNYFDSINFDLLVPVHCTGREVAMLFKDHFEEKVKLSSVGDTFIF